MKEYKIDIDKEKQMYIVCTGILAVCFAMLLFLQPLDSSMFLVLDKEGFINQGFISRQITGAIVLNASEEGAEGPLLDLKKPDNVTLVIDGNITEEMALNALLQAEKDMQEMMGKGFKASWVNDTLIMAKKAFYGENYSALLSEAGKIKDAEKRELAKQLLLAAQKTLAEGEKVEADYSLVIEKTYAISARKQRAYFIQDSIKALGMSIDEFKRAGLPAAEAEGIVAKASGEFDNERYENAENLVEEANKKLGEIKAESTIARTIYKAGKETFVNFIKTYYVIMLAFAVMLAVIGVFSYNGMMIKLLKGKIKDMAVEQEVLEELIKKAQIERYEKQTLSKESYEIKKSKYRERLLEIKRNLPVLQANLEKRLNAKRRK